MTFLNEALNQIDISDYNNYIENKIESLNFQYNYDFSFEGISKDNITENLIESLFDLINEIYQKTSGKNISPNNIGRVRNVDRNYWQNVFGQYFVELKIDSPINEIQKIRLTIPNRPIIEHYQYGNGSKIVKITSKKDSDKSIKNASKKIVNEINLIGFNIIKSIKFYISSKFDPRYDETPVYSIYMIYELSPEYQDIKNGFIKKYGDYPEYGEKEWNEQFGLNDALIEWR